MQASQVMTKPVLTCVPQQQSKQLIKIGLELAVVLQHNGSGDLQIANALVEHQKKITEFLQKKLNGLATQQDCIEFIKLVNPNPSKEEIASFMTDLKQYKVSCKNFYLHANHVDKNSTYVALEVQDLVSLDLIKEFFEFIDKMFEAKFAVRMMLEAQGISLNTKSNEDFIIKKFKLDIQAVEKEVAK